MMGRGSNRSASSGRLDLWAQLSEDVRGLSRARDPISRGEGQAAVDVGNVRVVVVRDRETELEPARPDELAQRFEAGSRAPALPTCDCRLMPPDAPAKLLLRQTRAEASFTKEIGAEHVLSSIT
jgi:hypothetical protein